MNRIRLRGSALVLTLGLLLTGCASRVADAGARAGAGDSPVAFAQGELDRLRDAVAAGVAAPRSPAPGTQPARSAAGFASGGGAGMAGGAPGRALNAAHGSQTGGVRALAAPDGTRPAQVARDSRTGGRQAAAPTAAKAAPAPCTQPGAPLHVGQVGNFSGVLGPIWSSARTALAVWAKDLNAGGGLACHPVVVHAQDDGGDPARSASIVQDLVDNKKAVAIVGSFTVLSVIGFKSSIESMRVPAVGGDVLSAQWTESPYLFPQGGGVLGQILSMLKLSMEEGRSRFGMVYCVETSVCVANKKLFAHYAEPMGGKWLYESPVSVVQPDYTAQCQNAKSAGVDVFILALDGSSIQRLGRSCASLDYYPLLVATGLALGETISKDPNLRRSRILTANLNAPWMLDDLPGQRDFHRALRTWAPDQPADGPSITAWAAGKLLEAALATLGEDAKRPVTSAMVMQGLGGLRNETLGGLAPPLTFAPGQDRAPAIPAAFYALLTDKGWTAPHGSRLFRVPVVVTDGREAGTRPYVVAPPARLRRPAR